MNEKNEKTSSCCCSCEIDMEKEIADLVKNGTEPTKANHDQRQSEIEAAFAESNKA